MKLKQIKTSLNNTEFKKFQDAFKKSGFVTYAEFARFIIYSYLQERAGQK